MSSTATSPNAVQPRAYASMPFLGAQERSDSGGLPLIDWHDRRPNASPVDSFVTEAPNRVHLRTVARAGAATRARGSLIVEQGNYLLAQCVQNPKHYSKKSLHQAQSHYAQAHSLNPHSLEPVVGLIQTAETQLVHIRPFAPCDKHRAQTDIVLALSAIVDFLTHGTDPDLATILGRSYPLLAQRLSRRVKQLVLHRLMSTLALLLTAAAYETTGPVRVMALKTLAHLVANQAWAATGALEGLDAWATQRRQIAAEEMAAGCDVVRQALGQNKMLAPKCSAILLALLEDAGDEEDRRALCVPLMSTVTRELNSDGHGAKMRQKLAFLKRPKAASNA